MYNILADIAALLISQLPFHNVIIFILDNPPHLTVSNITVWPVNLSLSGNILYVYSSFNLHAVL